MADNVSRSSSSSSKLRELTNLLRTLDQDLKSSASPSGAALREFRQALDNVRMTAWTVQELLNAREAQKDPEAMISFLTAERLRRFNQMVQDLCGDLEHEGANWPAQGIQRLQKSVSLLREGLGKLTERNGHERPSKQ